MINVEDFNPNLLKRDKNSHKKIDIYYIGYIKIKNISDYKSSNSVNPLYFTVGKTGEHIEEINGNRYLVFHSTDKNKEVSKNIQNFRMELKI